MENNCYLRAFTKTSNHLTHLMGKKNASLTLGTQVVCFVLIAVEGSPHWRRSSAGEEWLLLLGWGGEDDRCCRRLAGGGRGRLLQPLLQPLLPRAVGR